MDVAFLQAYRVETTGLLLVILNFAPNPNGNDS
jgi:hypothetical protein